MSLRFKQTDSAEVIRYTALDARKQPVNLIGTTVRFLMAKRDAAGVAVNEPAVVTDGMSGKIEYRPSDSAMLQAGVFNAEFHVEWPDGRRKIYPSDGYLQITIAPSLDVNQPGVIEEQIVMRITAIEEFKDEIVAEVDGFRGELVGVEQATNNAGAAANNANQAAGRANDAAELAEGRVAELEGLDVVQLDGRVSEVSAQLVENTTDINDRGFNIRNLGIVLDGTVDVYQDIMNALAAHKNVVVPGDAIIGTTNTIVVGQGQSLVGLADNVRGYGKTATIKYIGSLNRHKAVVRLGKNAVDAEPILDGTDIQFKNFIVDANNLAGFGVYGTFLTNETTVDNIVTRYSLEYGVYIARSWYAKYKRLVAMNNEGRGIAFGMPLEYSDGTMINWTISSPLEMNNCPIVDIRAIQNGKYFSDLNPNNFDPMNPTHRRKGYGIGFGLGNSFNASTFTSERNGGVGVYVFNGAQPIKTLKDGYLENNCMNSGLDPATTMAQMIIENTSASGGNIEIKDVFMNYNYGGIYHTGVLGRKVWLRNIQQPRFLKSLDGLTAFQLYAEVLKAGVAEGCGLYNTLETISRGIDIVQTVDTRGFTAISTKQTNGYKLIFIKSDGTTPWGSYTLNYDDGTTASRSFPNSLGTSYVLSTVANGNLTSITKSGITGGTVSNVTFKVVDTPFTYI